MKKLWIVLAAALLVGSTSYAEGGGIAPIPGISPETVTAHESTFQERMELAVQNKRAAQAETKIKDETPLTSNSLRMFSGLALCVGLFLIGAWFFRRASGRGNTVNLKSMRIIERMSVTSKTSLLLIEVEGRRVMVSAGPDKVSFFAPEAEVSDSDRAEAFTLKEELIELCEEQARFSA